MSPRYLATPIAEAKRVDIDPRRYMTAGGYTKQAGAPTSVMIRLEGEKRWRRVMVWQFSNAGTAFVRIKGDAFIVRDIPEV